ncbi:MAG: GNAT family N-acetyltransferase [Gammaproteobacteria bacterium]|nr:GNAT family N-acetyltransferase [Gammaproteobacteria bacterium]
MKQTPWDYPCLGMPSYEVSQFSNEIFDFIKINSGHFTLKIDPLLPSKQFIDAGFYYCDTLVEPFCSEERFIAHYDEKVGLMEFTDTQEVQAMIANVFVYSRFYRDFNIDNSVADKRYSQWLTQLVQSGNVFRFTYGGESAGFVAYVNNKLVLHALQSNYRGKGLAKFFWTQICQKLFLTGHKEITSSISMANTTILNLYSSLGFKFRHAQDIYHLLKD